MKPEQCVNKESRFESIRKLAVGLLVALAVVPVAAADASDAGDVQSRSAHATYGTYASYTTSCPSAATGRRGMSRYAPIRRDGTYVRPDVRRYPIRPLPRPSYLSPYYY